MNKNDREKGIGLPVTSCSLGSDHTQWESRWAGYAFSSLLHFRWFLSDQLEFQSIFIYQETVQISDVSFMLRWH